MVNLILLNEIIYKKMSILCRFAPSPTGFLHVGNIRAAIVNFLYCKKVGGRFVLRLDDTDKSRSSDEFRDMIIKDMKWLGLEFDELVKQSDRLDKYEEAKNVLLKSGRVYECFESEEELKIQRNNQIAAGQRPLYNRHSLNLSEKEKQKLLSEGRKPHYRFLLQNKKVSWKDKIRGEVEYHGIHFSDPVVFRENGCPTYTFCSVVDDLQMGVSDIIRGEDHITNTAIQIQIFESLIEAGFEGKIPHFAHLALIKAIDGKISKRVGGFDVKSLRQDGIEPMALLNLLAQIGTSMSIKVYKTFEELVKEFSFSSYSKSATNYDLDEVKIINQKLIQMLDFEDVKDRLEEIGVNVSEEFYRNVRANLSILADIKIWDDICNKPLRNENAPEDKEFLQKISLILPENTRDVSCWVNWFAKIKEISDRRGKSLFMPIRKALTGLDSGPDLPILINLIDRQEILARLRN